MKPRVIGSPREGGRRACLSGRQADAHGSRGGPDGAQVRVAGRGQDGVQAAAHLLEGLEDSFQGRPTLDGRRRLLPLAPEPEDDGVAHVAHQPGDGEACLSGRQAVAWPLPQTLRRQAVQRVEEVVVHQAQHLPPLLDDMSG
jgi:hypothetical protein